MCVCVRERERERERERAYVGVSEKRRECERERVGRGGRRASMCECDNSCKDVKVKLLGGRLKYRMVHDLRYGTYFEEEIFYVCLIMTQHSIKRKALHVNLSMCS